MFKLKFNKEKYKEIEINNVKYNLKIKHYNEYINNVFDIYNFEEKYNISLDDLIELIQCDFVFISVSKDRLLLTSSRYDIDPYYDVVISKDEVDYYKYSPFSIVNNDVNYMYYKIELKEFQTMLDTYYPKNEYKKMVL